MREALPSPVSEAARTLRGILRRAAAGLLLALLAGAVQAGTVETLRLPAQDYPGGREREYKVYRPDGLSGPAPLVMALHGCRQTHDDVLADWGLRAAADRHRFILVAPFITSYDGWRNPNCWGFWMEDHRHQGRGEPEDLYRIAREVESRHAIDPARRYIVGLSSGGAMSVVAAVTHNEYWAAAASVAGLGYGEDAAAVSLSGNCPGSARLHPVERVVADMRAELNDGYPIPLLVIQNERDCTVVQPAGRILRDAHLAAHGADPLAGPVSLAPCTPVFGGDDYRCRHARHAAEAAAGGRSMVEAVFYDGPLATPSARDEDHGHYWIGGEHGADGAYALREGPVHPEIVWDFFVRHPRTDAEAAGRPRLAIAGDNPLRLPQGTTFADPGARAWDAAGEPVAVSADCGALDTARAGSHVCDYRAVDAGGREVRAQRLVEVVDPAAPALRCVSVRASPLAHLGAGRARAGGWFFSRALAGADRQDIGYAWDWWSVVALHEGEAGRWHAHRPPVCER